VPACRPAFIDWTDGSASFFVYHPEPRES